MATKNSNKYGTGAHVLTAQEHCAIVVACVVSIAAADAALTDGDILNLCVVPANHRVVGLSLACGDLDANVSAAITFDVGLMDKGDTALDTVFVADSTLGQAGGTLAIPATATMFETEAATADKVLAVEIKTTAATKHADARKFTAIVTYMPA